MNSFSAPERTYAAETRTIIRPIVVVGFCPAGVQHVNLALTTIEQCLAVKVAGIVRPQSQRSTDQFERQTTCGCRSRLLLASSAGARFDPARSSTTADAASTRGCATLEIPRASATGVSS